MAHPRNLPKQDLKAQYYSRRRSSLTTSSSLPTPSSSSQSQPFSSSQRSSISSKHTLLSIHSDATVEALLERSKAVLQDWEAKKGTPALNIRKDVYPEMKEEMMKEAPAPTLTLKPRTEAGYYKDRDENVKPVAVGEIGIQEEMAVEIVQEEVIENTEREGLTTIVADDADGAAMEQKDKRGTRIELLNIITQTIEEESPPSLSTPPPVPAVPSPPTSPPVTEPKPAPRTPVEVSAPPAVPKEWKAKPKIHDWFCASHKSSTSSLDPYKCTRCTKRRVASKGLLRSDAQHIYS